jgi:hypothetical protein
VVVVWCAVLLPAPEVRAHVRDRGEARGGGDGVLVGRCGVAVSAGVREKVVQLLHVQLPLVRGELHEPNGVQGIDGVEPGGRAVAGAGEGGVRERGGVPAGVRAVRGGDERGAVHGRVGILFLLGRVRGASSGLVHVRDVRIRRFNRLLRECGVVVRDGELGWAWRSEGRGYGDLEEWKMRFLVVKVETVEWGRSKEVRVYICRAFVELQGAVEGCIGE